MIFYKILIFIFFTLILHAGKINITSTSMRANNLNKEVHFVGNAKVEQDKSWIHGNEIIVYFNENNETKKYEAIGKVTFEFDQKKNLYQGSANKIIYYPGRSKYVLQGKAVVNDLTNKRHVNGDEIVLDAITGNVNVKGSKTQPVKFIFNTKEKK